MRLKIKPKKSRWVRNLVWGMATVALLSLPIYLRHSSEPDASPQYESTVRDAENSLGYNRARFDPIEQEKWVEDKFTKHGVRGLFDDIIIVTPENADKYEHEFNRKEHVRDDGRAGGATTVYSGKVADIGTPMAPKPRFYVPTEAFSETEGNLTALLAYHEADHAKVYTQGFDFLDMRYFYYVDNPNAFHLRQFMNVMELEGIRNQLENGSGIMTKRRIEDAHREHMKYYIQLWNAVQLRQTTTDAIKLRYFEPWMRTTDSIWVYEEGPNKDVKYGGNMPAPFFACNNDRKCYVQFVLRDIQKPTTFRLELPSSITQN